MAVGRQVVSATVFLTCFLALLNFMTVHHAEYLWGPSTLGGAGQSFRGGVSAGACGDFAGYPIHRDFAQYEAAAVPESYLMWCAEIQQACLTVQIRDGRIYVRHLFPGYQSRHRSTLHALYRVSQRFDLPDADLVIEVSDWVPQLDSLDIPVLRITRPSTGKGIVYPDFTFYSWPEAICPPERSHSYGHLLREFANVTAFAEKKDVLFWRGGRVSNAYRSQAVALLANLPGADVNFMDWHSVSITGNNGAPGCVGLAEHCDYRYLAFLEGNTYSSRWKYMLFCGSVVFAGPPQWQEWWTEQLVPEKHYIQVVRDWSTAYQRLREVRARSDKGANIAQNGRQFALDNLNEQSVDCYWAAIIKKAHEVLPRAPLAAHAKPVEDVLLFGNDVRISEGTIEGPVEFVR